MRGIRRRLESSAPLTLAFGARANNTESYDDMAKISLPAFIDVFLYFQYLAGKTR